MSCICGKHSDIPRWKCHVNYIWYNIKVFLCWLASFIPGFMRYREQEFLRSCKDSYEKSLFISPLLSACTRGKSACTIKLDKNMQRYQMMDIINIHVRSVGLALARHKEQKTINVLSSLAFPIQYYDGDSLKDLVIKALANLPSADTIVIHTLLWVYLATGKWRQEISSVTTEDVYKGNGGVWRIAGSLLNIIVSPFIAYHSITTTSDILVLDSQKAGELVTYENLHIDPKRDEGKLVFWERYHIEPKSGASVLIKDVSVKREIAVLEDNDESE